jgi:fucose permease
MITRKQKIGLLATFATLAAFALSSNAVPPLATTIAKDLGVSYVNFGYIFMLQFVCFALASVIGGWAASKFGIANRSLVIFGVLSVGLIQAAGSLLPSFGWFIAWAIPLGFMGGLVETFGSIMVCRFGGTQSSKLMNLAQVFFCLGAIFGPMLVGLMLGANLSWQIAFLTLGSAIFLIGIYFTVMTRNVREPQIEVAVDPTDAPPPPAVRIPLYRDKLFYLLAASLFLYVCVECSAVCWVPAYFEEYLHLPASSAAQRLSLFWIGMIAGRLVTIVLPSRWTLWPALFVGAAGMMIANLLLSVPHSVAIASGLVMISALGAGPLWPVIVTLSQKFRQHAAFTSCVIGAGALGAAAGPFLSSVAIKVFGMKALFPTLTCGGVILLAVLFLARSCATGEQTRRASSTAK